MTTFFGLALGLAWFLCLLIALGLAAVRTVHGDYRGALIWVVVTGVLGLPFISFALNG